MLMKPRTMIAAMMLIAVTALSTNGAQMVADDNDETADQPGERSDTGASLDDLLGLDEDERDEGAEDAARRDVEEDLQRRLTEQEIAGAFREAVEKMDLSARLLDESFDTGLGTQRIQQEIIAKLEQLIEQAQNQPMGSADPGGEQSPEPQQDPGQQQQQNQQQQNDQQQNSDSGDGAENMPPGFRQDDQIGTEMDEEGEEWGALPDRIRDMLLQGRQERFSGLYEQWTREYYRRLAEEN